VHEDLQAFMFNVQLPTVSMEAAQELQLTLDQQHNIYIVVIQVDGLVFTRLSSQVYLQKSDFERLGVLVPKIPSQHRKGSISTINGLMSSLNSFNSS